ncbi:unnamed protein product [Bursaphelenchus okinawaensis]|uniref:sphingomyelin phosphodiesterase n=1 Tax=Bursaphelenchus okinawaensis TaxID=465554 RepID=A0A811LNZ2_9BILA|nr:unnamed protein product [Bursaphelenchus okinawaensis]CAG9125200.1 unnamed protein product [Bursaphelenchus okinawaensis]
MKFKLVTLNIWLLPYPHPLGSKDRKYRLEKFCEELKELDVDVVCLQELWNEKDFLYLHSELLHKFPHGHYFHSGFTGSGVGVLSAHKIKGTLIHRYSLNGFAHHVHRGDWFGGKIVGMVELDWNGKSVTVYTTHLHAEYNRENDLYLPHRIAQCFELAQFVRYTSGASDMILLAGDFNIEPEDLGYLIIRYVGNLYDAWENRPNVEDKDGMTCERPDNIYTPAYMRKACPEGKRLDYIMYQSGKSCLQLEECTTCFNHINDDKPTNFSDHVGVTATFKVSSGDDSPSADVCLPNVPLPNSFLEKALTIVEEGEVRVLWDRRLFMAMCIIAFSLILLTINLENVFPSTTLIVETSRFILTLFIGFCLWHGLVGLTMERKALRETKHTIRNMLNMDADLS